MIKTILALSSLAATIVLGGCASQGTDEAAAQGSAAQTAGPSTDPSEYRIARHHGGTNAYDETFVKVIVTPGPATSRGHDPNKAGLTFSVCQTSEPSMCVSICTNTFATGELLDKVVGPEMTTALAAFDKNFEDWTAKRITLEEYDVRNWDHSPTEPWEAIYDLVRHLDRASQLPVGSEWDSRVRINDLVIMIRDGIKRHATCE